MSSSRDGVVDFHTHTFHSDGSLSPMEIVRRATINGYKAIGLTDHVGMGGVADLIERLRIDREIIERYWPIRVVVGVELTHVPTLGIADAAAHARRCGAEVIIVHGETLVEPVPEGTNHAAIGCGMVDILAHPGLLTVGDAELAARHNVYLELTSRRGHSLTNGHVQKTAALAAAKLVVNSDSHDPGDLLTHAFQERVTLGSGIGQADLQRVLVDNPDELLARLISRRVATASN